MRRTVRAGVVAASWAALATSAMSGCANKQAGFGPAAVPGPGSVRAQNDCEWFAATVKADGIGGAPVTGGVLPADAHPVSLLKCVWDSRDIPGQGQWLVVDTVRSTGSVDAFVSALRASYVKPPEPTPTNGPVACADAGYVAQWIVLVDADGTAYQIAIPLWGLCSDPDPDVMKALTAVKTEVASTERIRQTASPGAQASRCSQQFAEMAFVNAQAAAHAGPGTLGPFFSGSNPAKTLSVCYYKMTGTPDRIKPSGDFEAAATLTGSRGAAVYDGLTTAPIAAATAVEACDAPATEYAVLDESTSWSVVELDGCRLAAPDSGPDRQAPAAVIQALLAAKK